MTATVPPNSTTAFAVGSVIHVAQMGTGQVTISPGSGVTLNSAGGALKTRGQYSVLSIEKTDTNTWLVYGDIDT